MRRMTTVRRLIEQAYGLEEGVVKTPFSFTQNQHG